jgi:hypothetical protein
MRSTSPVFGPGAPTVHRPTPWQPDEAGDLLLNPAELEQWLCAGTPLVPRREDLESAFGVGLDRTADAPFPTYARRLRLTLAVLRDTFADDVALRGWIHRFHPELGRERPLDLLRSGRIDQLEALAVREWNRLAAASTFTTIS